MQAVDLLQFGFIENLQVYRIYMLNRARSLVKYLTTELSVCALSGDKKKTMLFN